MNISFNIVTVDFEMIEIHALYSSIKHSLHCTIEGHWVNHPDSYEQHEATRLQMLKQLCRITGNDYEYDSAELKRVLETCVKARNSKTAQP